jgi:hypothetical protein
VHVDGTRLYRREQLKAGAEPEMRVGTRRASRQPFIHPTFDDYPTGSGRADLSSAHRARLRDRPVQLLRREDPAGFGWAVRDAELDR